MQKKYCRYCGKEIESDSKFCPYCGKNLEESGRAVSIRSSSAKSEAVKLRMDSNMKFFIAAIIICVLGVIGMIQNGTFGKGGNSSTKQEAENYQSELISYDEYAKIEPGMTYDQVIKIIGSPGKELSRASLGDYESIVIMWDGEGEKGANANITFQNGKVMAKAQVGLE